MAGLGEIIPDGVMLGRDIVPDDQRVLVPADPALHAGCRFDVVEQHFQQVAAFQPADAFNLCGEAAVDPQQGLAIIRMGNHQRMHGPVLAGPRRRFFAIALAPWQGAVMHGLQRADQRTHRL